MEKGYSGKVDIRAMESDSVKSIQVHHFGNASSGAYETVIYLRFVCKNDSVFCRFIFSKARLAPLKTISIPHLELTAAVLAVKIDQMLKHELILPNWRTIFWTDSTAVLRMIANTNRRFPVFIANRLTKIEEHSTSDQWRNVPTKKNLADFATRGINAELFVSNSSTWLQEPKFLSEIENLWPQLPCPLPHLPVEFLILKKSFSAVSKTNTESLMEVKFSRFSTWYKLKKSVAWILRKNKLLHKEIAFQSISVDELDQAEKEIMMCVQQDRFSEEVIQLRSGKQHTRNNCLRKLNSFVSKGILCVEGRLQQSLQPFDVQHPIILSSSHHVTKLIIKDHQRTVGHLVPA